jgi:hypothetical protein
MTMEKISRSAAQVTPYRGWDDVSKAVEEVIASVSEPLHPDTRANLNDLLSVCRDKSPFPIGVGKGYWSTIVLWWNNFEIEVFEDRLEVYRFSDRGTDIWYEEHIPGGTFTARFLAELTGLQ